ncbi:Spy0128 family protein [Lachnoclostridium sp. An118]|uniref:Spy0128 family protein n=1 Tax=Lachnoclostridium sp. An118 TaxID=1965547 RepID=UPI000B374D12|nr:FctA domain-containing protein [Lachnoclostridium sp. An118]OUQ48606.1 hypothetical protein B5E62_12775 [Lachnoclostridium sp. An118]
MKGRRVLAGLLAAVMIMNSGVLSSYASDTQAPVEESVQTDTAPSEEQSGDKADTQLPQAESSVSSDSGAADVQEGQGTGNQNVEAQDAEGQNAMPRDTQTPPASGQDTQQAAPAAPAPAPAVELSVSISSSTDRAAYGDTVTLTGNVSVEEAALQWQYSSDQGASWQDVSGQTGPSYTFQYSETNASYVYRLHAAYGGATADSNTLTIAQSKTFAEVAEEYYGENGTVTPATVTISRQTSGDTVKAGEILPLRLEYVLKAAAVYNYGEQVEPLYDEYTTIEVRLRLPEGLSIVNEEEILDDVKELIRPDDSQIPGDKENNIWTFKIAGGVRATTDTTRSFNVNVRVDGNGEIPVGTWFDFAGDEGEPENLAEIRTEFTIKDRTDPDHVTDGKTYDKTTPMNGTVSDVRTETDDEWVVDKTAVDAKADSKKEKVTVTYTLNIGLKGSEGEAVSNPATYGRPGRVPFKDGKAEISLKETPSVHDRDGNPITAESITITPQFGDKKSIQVPEAGVTVTVPVDTCQGKDISATTDVAGTAPFFSSYTVEVVYPYEKFIASYKDVNQAMLKVENNVEISYTLAGEDQIRTDDGRAEQEAGEVTPPAELTIGKYIFGYNNDDPQDYIYDNFPAGDIVSGPARFQIEYADEPGKYPDLYVKKEDNTYEKLEVTDGTVTIEPENEVLSPTTTVYLDAGTYVITEVACPENTRRVTAEENEDYNADPREVILEAGKGATTDFYNIEKLGAVTVEKKGFRDGNETVLQDAKFGLYTTEACRDEDQVGEPLPTGANGRVTFDRLPYGTYYLKEVEAPEGYIKDSTVRKVIISEENKTETVTFTNKYNQAYVVMQKKIRDVGTGSYENVDQIYSGEFTERFSLEKEVAKGQWETVEDKLSLGQNGQILQALPVYEDDGTTLIRYRFAELLPDGWYAPEETELSTDKTTAYSEEFTLENDLGNSTATRREIIMKNDRNGSITLTKKFYEAAAGGMKETQSGTATFELYYKNGEKGTLTKYGDSSYEVSAGNPLTIRDLPRTEGSEDRYYYLVETELPEGYGASQEDLSGNNAAERTTVTINEKELTAYGPFNFTEEMKEGSGVVLAQDITIANVEQKVPVVVKKENSYTHSFVAGASYTVSLYDKKTGEKGQTVIGQREITDAAGSLAKLDPGATYIVEETVTPVGYHNVTDADDLIIDLTDVTVDTGTKGREVTIKNEPDPTMTVEKVKVDAAGKKTDLTGVEFEVYTKNADGSMQPATGYDGKSLSLTAGGAALQLPAGQYYLKEVVPEDNPNQILDPSRHSNLYAKEDGVSVDGSFYFGPYEVKQQQAVNDLGTITNYSDKGAVQVRKYRAAVGSGAKVEQDGATIGIFTENADGELERVASVKSADGGIAEFKDIPIYDADGDKIKYIVKEIEAPAGFTVSEEEFQVELEAGKTVTTDTKKAPLEFVNQPVTSLTVTKSYYNMWEHAFTGKSYALPGTVIALYQKERETYTFKETQVADEDGRVTFNGLTQKDEYVAIEVRVPDDDAYTYLEPKGKKAYLDPDYQEDKDLPPELTASELANYSYVTKAANPSDVPEGAQSGELINVENWAQLRVEKFAIETQDTETTDIGERREINNAEFTLYRQVLDDVSGIEDTDRVLTFDSADCTVVGSYTSGTFYEDKERQDGWFSTDILKSANNVVYWLVETKAGIGSEIIPENAVTLIKREGTKYSNNSMYQLVDDEGNPVGDPVLCTNEDTYHDNKVTEDVAVENKPLYGEGGGMFSTVRIAKWAGKYNDTGEKIHEYTPLGNAVFELYLADKEGRLYESLGEMTTGLDNTIQEDEPQGDLDALASSRMFEWTDLQKDYAERLENPDICTVDKDGNVYVRVAIVEKDVPTGYMADKDCCYMYMYFQNVPGKVTEIFNDAYYVTGDQTEEKVPLAEDQNDIQWALYPTRENGDGSYGLVAGVGETSKYRLVNWPVDAFAVTVQKYGYEVQEDNEGYTSQQLDEYYFSGAHTDRVGLPMVMRLDRLQDGKWTPYNYDGNTQSGQFTTDASGRYVFRNGLRLGSYRIVEVRSASGYEDLVNQYEMIYDGSTPQGASGERSAQAYYFNVTADNVDVSMYNPKKVELDIRKTDVGGTTNLSGVTYTLIQQDGSGKVTATTDNSGKASLEGIGTGTYKLTETGSQTHSGSYFSEYFEATYGGKALNNLVNGDGLFLGYTVQSEPEPGEKSGLIVTEKKDLSSYGLDAGLSLDIENPRKGGFTIQKTDKLTNGPLKEAQFQVSHQKFTGWGGDQAFTDTGWSEPVTYTTDEDGTCQVTGQEPGLYRIKETKAPGGYDITDSAFRYFVITGGMDIGTVTLGAQEVTMKDPKESLAFKDSKQVHLTVTKKINKGELSVSGSSAFTFALYNEAKTQIDTIKITSVDGGDVQGTFKVGLSQGGTYYLKETGIPSGFAFESLEGTAGLTLTEEEDGYYRFTVPESNSNLAVTAVNRYLQAEVAVLKVNGETGERLSGADFAIYRMNGQEQGEKLDVTFTEDVENQGVYRVVVPLSANQSETFRIYETKQPEDYLLNSQQHVEVTVGPGEKQQAPVWNASYANDNDEMLAERIFPNYRGAYIDLTKYDNVHDSKDAAPLEGARFTLYQYNEDSGTWTASADDVTSEDGTLRFTVTDGEIYAVDETAMPAGYNGAGLEGVWTDLQDEKVEAQQITVAGTGGEPETATVYPVNGSEPLEAGRSYRYNAYNIPHVPMEIRKQNVDGSAPAPTATVSVYEMPDGMSDTPDRAAVEELLADGSALLNGVEVDQFSKDKDYTYAEDPRLQTTFVAGKRYLVVETDSSISQIRDDSSVTWYTVVKYPEGTRAGQTAVLKNINGTADLTLVKSAEQAEYTSLFTQGADITYTITPSVNNTYPLHEFVLEDTGLEAYYEDGSQEYQPMGEGTLDDQYSITSVTVGQSSHDTGAYKEPGNDTIYAEVTFKGFDGKTYEMAPVNVSQGAATVQMPGDKGRAESFSIRYYSEGIAKASDNAYVLGTDFNPGPVTARVQVQKQEGGPDAHAIAMIRNSADSTLKYYTWTGAGARNDTPEEITQSADADVTFKDQTAALVSVTKEADTATVRLEDTVTYSLTLENKSTLTAEEATMREPFLVDLLPQGTTWARTDDEYGVTLEAGSTGITLSHTRSQSHDGETAVFIYMNGSLEPGEQVTVKIQVKAEKEVVSYGPDLNNYVLAGSDEKGEASVDNPRAASFKNENGKWPESVDTVLSSLPQDRRDDLKQILGERKEHGFVSAGNTLTWNTGSEMQIVKSGYGNVNAEAGYSSTTLSTITNEGGLMHYRLTASNTNEQDGRTDISFVDVLPEVGDETANNADRDSAWSLDLKEVASVSVIDEKGVATPVPADKYKVYCYTTQGPIASYTDIYNAAKVIKYATETPPAGWSEGIPTDPAALSDVRAFIVAVSDELKLGAQESLVVEYTAVVNSGEGFDSDDLTLNAWNNAVNTCACHYSSYSLSVENPVPSPASEIIESNAVSTTIVPEGAKVGGHVWIDKDNDGLWEEGEDIADLSGGNRLIQDLLDKMVVQLYTYTGTSNSSSDTTSYVKGSQWGGYFEFGKENADPDDPMGGLLTPAGRKNVSDDTLYPDNVLDPAQLKGTAPVTYTIGADFQNAKGKFEVAKTLNVRRMSFQPGHIPDDHKTDNNFTYQNSSAVSERFYLWSGSETYDTTKDIGLVPYRDLEITKVADDDPNEFIEGAQFTVYGPFDEKAESYELNEKVGTYTTDSDGKVTVPNLLWYKKYIIVETGADAGSEAEGYLLTGATGKATVPGTDIENLENEKPAWVLGVPTAEKEDALDKMTVTNKRQTEVQLTASKKLMMNGQEQKLEADQFTFELLDDDGTTVLDTRKNDDEGKVIFKKLILEGAGERIYYIREKIEGDDPKDGITYDTSLYKVTVNVQWDAEQNKLVPEITYEKQAKDETKWETASDVTFENIYNATGSLDLTAAKTVNGEKPQEAEAGRFSFTLLSGADTPTVNQTKYNDADGRVTFDPIQYDTDDIGQTYTYTVKEGTVQADSGLADNYTPDGAEYTVTVTISDAGKGKLNVDKTITKDGKTVEDITFNNTYTASASWTPEASKILTGRDITNGEFSFEVLEGTDVVSRGSVSAGTAGQTAAINFDSIEYDMDNVGIHTYTVKETTKNGNGVTVDTNRYEVTVTVSDNRNGSLGITAVYPKGGITFSNSYQAEKTSYEPKVTKTVTGQQMPAGGQEFTFTLSQIDGQNYDGVTMPANATLKLKAESTGVQVSGSFEAITFAKAGSYQFKIEEEAGNAAGVTYDPEDWILTVSVKDDLTGNLYIDTTETIYQTEDGGAGDDAAAAFENIYQPQSTPLALKAVKTVTGNAMPGAKDFTFLLAAGGTYTGDQLEMPKDLTATAHVTETGTPVEALFQEITFKQAGEYSFTITEQKPQSGQEGGYHYSDARWNVVVKVTDEAGQLKAEATYTCADESNQTGAAFENRYNPEDAPFTPEVRKTLNGYEDLPGQTDFTFTLTAAEDNPAGASLENGKSITTSLPMTAQTTEGRGTATFEEITFDRTGIYTFAISENGTDGKGFDYDETKWTLTVTVTDDNGTLKAEGSYAPKDGTANDEAAAFTNSYTVKEIPYTPEAVKQFTEDSADRPQNKETFTFTLKQADGNREGGAVFTNGEEALKASVTDAGKAAFDGQITFKKSGQYSFLITEDVPDTKSYNYGYDDTKWTLQVKVMDKEGQLTVESVSYTADDGRTGDGQAVFSNSYKVDPTAYAPQVEKTVTGADMPDGQSFTFDLKKIEGESYEGVTMPQGQPGSSIQIKTDKTGESYTGKFGEIGFAKAGEYRFAITEQDDTADSYPDEHYGFGYDKTEWTLTVTVEDVGGKLDVTSTAYESRDHETSETEASFENSYQTEPTDYAPAVVKTLSDDSEPTPADETFIFTLTGEEQDGAVLPSDTEAEVSGEGTARFDNIHFTKAGRYSFTIKEKPGSAEGYTYDPAEWTLTVTVDDLGGKLSVIGTVYEAKGQESSQTAAAFENAYHVDPVSFAPEVQKKLTGDKAPDDKTFIFNLEAGEESQGMALPEETTAEITGEGKAAFDEVTFTKAGTYILVITEEDTREPGYTYDETVWTVTAEVVDKGGYLEVEDVTYQSSDETADSKNADSAVFTNRFTYTEAEYTPSVRKNISGDKPGQNDTFTFTLKQSLWDDKEAVQLTGASASVVNSGTAQFGRILFGKPGTYEFKIQEDKGSAAGYTYDRSTWTLKVTVVNEENVLVVESAVYTKNGTNVTSTEAAAFTNTYSAARAARTGDISPWQPLAAALILSGGVIVVLHRRRKRQAE